ncbi:Bax inhibitor-1/YccA family protein [Imhoffiella purpurea]|uniref:Putative TEGT family carrier/transport protein n=1 Tax=Imhoffiella purpurea TaxID=1249627 RepID=W9VEI5_9GAMM|nr:Bax inhibitor-1/YccA family protein [Imhoffiella purpurea]EXJ15391.1 Putative TEGT family carrier/transport protein [Imhoffiella purpurea]
MANPGISFVKTDRASPSVETNKVLKNTYMLLAATLGFSALTAMLSLVLAVPPWTYMASVIVSMLLGMFVLPRTANSAAGIGVIFLITGLLGFGLGAILSIYLALPNGPQIVGLAFGGTATIFLGLSGYALTSKRDFSFMGGFIFAGMMVVMIAVIANIFLQMPALALAISSAIILLMSGFILFDTSRIARGEETNYILATYGLYLSIFNIFISLLQILGIMSDD